MTPKRPSRPRITLEPELRAAFLRLIEARFGLRLSDHQARHLDESVSNILGETEHTEAHELYQVLSAGWRDELLKRLAVALTIGETHFFRIKPQMDALRQVVLPDLIAKRSVEHCLRMWSAGCSTGEEPYTLAILVSQQLAHSESWDVRIVGTDLSPQSLESARAALYGEWSFRESPADVRRRYFVRDGERWRLGDAPRAMVKFGILNLLADPFPPLQLRSSKLDLILCRNVTIYFSLEAVRQVYARFAEVLAPGGWLVLGPSDPPPSHPGSFEPVNVQGAVLWRHRAFVSSDLGTASPVVPVTTIPAKRVEPAVTRPLAVAPTTAIKDKAPAEMESIWTLAHAGRRGEARRQAEQVVRARPLGAEAHLLLGMLCLDEGATEQGLASLRRAVFLAPELALAQFGLGRIYIDLGDAGRAVAALNRARSLLGDGQDDQPVPGGGGLRAVELRSAVNALLASLPRASITAREGSRNGE